MNQGTFIGKQFVRRTYCLRGHRGARMRARQTQTTVNFKRRTHTNNRGGIKQSGACKSGSSARGGLDRASIMHTRLLANKCTSILFYSYVVRERFHSQHRESDRDAYSETHSRTFFPTQSAVKPQHNKHQFQSSHVE